MKAKITSGELAGTEFEVSEETIRNIKGIDLNEVEIKRYDDCVYLRVGPWGVFKLGRNGTGYLCSGIPTTNKEGLKVDREGRVLLENN